jgi:hypothetical protein
MDAPKHDSATNPSANCRFQFDKRGQLFIRPHNEPLSAVAMRISNPDRSSVEINR